MLNPYREYMAKQAAGLTPASVVGAGLGLGLYEFDQARHPGAEFDPFSAAWMTSVGGAAGELVGRRRGQQPIGQAAALAAKALRP